MSVDPAVEGRSYRMPGIHRVTSEEIATFRAAIGAPVAGYIAPPTFAVTIAQRAEAEFLKDPEARVEYTRLVHGEESFAHSAPIRADDELTAETTVTRVRSIGGNDMVTLTTQVATVAGELRCTTTSMVVIRGEESA